VVKPQAHGTKVHDPAPSSRDQPPSTQFQAPRATLPGQPPSTQVPGPTAGCCWSLPRLEPGLSGLDQSARLRWLKGVGSGSFDHRQYIADYCGLNSWRRS